MIGLTLLHRRASLTIISLVVIIQGLAPGRDPNPPLGNLTPALIILGPALVIRGPARLIIACPSNGTFADFRDPDLRTEGRRSYRRRRAKPRYHDLFDKVEKVRQADCIAPSWT